MSPSIKATSSTQNLRELTDEELVTNCKYELPYEARSYRVLIERYQREVLAKAETMLRDHEDAKDVAQEVFLKVYNNLPKFGMRSSFSTWIYIITVNTCLNLIDKRKRHPQWWLTEDIDNEFAQQEESEVLMIMGKGVERADVADCIESTMDDLGDSNREILELRFLEELDYHTIAEKLKVTLSAMKMRLKRAREQFRVAFEDQCMGGSSAS